MRFWIDFPRVCPFRPGVLFGLGDIGGSRRSPHPVIVTEQHADPVELVFQAFLRFDREQRATPGSAAQMALGRTTQAPRPQRPALARAGASGLLRDADRRVDLGDKIAGSIISCYANRRAGKPEHARSARAVPQPGRGYLVPWARAGEWARIHYPST